MQEQLSQDARTDEQAASAVALAQLQAQHQFSVRLLEIGAALAAQPSLSALAGEAVRLVVNTLPGVDGATLWLWRPDEERLRIAAVHSPPDLSIFDLEFAESFALRLHEGYAGEAVAIGQPLMLPDATALLHSLQVLDGADVAVVRERLSRVPQSLRVICLPLRVGAQPVGALDLYTTAAEPEIVLADLPLLHLFADQLAGLLLAAHRSAEAETQSRLLQAFDQVVTAMREAADVKQLLERALLATLELAGARHGMIALVEDGALTIGALQALPAALLPPGPPWNVGETIFASVVRTGQPDVQAVTPDHPWAELREVGVEAVALLPLPASGRLAGVLAIAGGHPLGARPEWPALLPLGKQVGMAVEHYRLHSVGQRERRRLATLVASLVEGVLLCDSAGELALFNQAANALLKPSLAVGMSIAELAHNLNLRMPDGTPLPVEQMPLARGLRGEVVRDQEVLIAGSAGEDIFLSCSTVPLYTEDGSIDGAVMVFRDVTAHKQYDAVRDEFLAVAAHELRAPLAAIKGYSDLLVKREIERPDGSERDRKGSVMLSRQVDHLVWLVDNLLDVSRIDTGRLELYLQSVDLILLLEACIDRISVGEPSHQFTLEGPPTLEIVCDQLRIQQVFTNLLANAARYSPPGTEINVQVWTEERPASKYASDQDHAVPWAVVAVHDQGVGIPPELQEQVFERYYRANTAHAASGLGLGLYLSREIVMRHGGRIWLHSEAGQGSTLYVALPLNLERTVAGSADMG